MADLENKDLGTENIVTNEGGSTEETPAKISFDELLKSDKEYQSAFDKKMTEAMKKREENLVKEWQEKQAESERLAKMSQDEKRDYEIQQLKDTIASYQKKEATANLKNEAIIIATEQGIPKDYLDLLDFSNMTAEQVKEKIEVLKNMRAKDLEDSLNNALKQKTPNEFQTNIKKEEKDPFIIGFDSTRQLYK